MECTYFEKYNQEAIALFDDVRRTLEQTNDDSLRSLVRKIPTSLYKDKRVNVVFAGQYSAGKSSLLSILTGKKLDVGGGITTEECQSFDWEGVYVTDTPGIHTQNRPDHDAITYEQLAKADLIVFVLTAEGFSDHLAHHFRKLINEKGKGHEMMLVVNKMDKTAKGNTKEQQDVLLNKDILPVISPYTDKDMYLSFVSTDYYNRALMPKYEKYHDDLIVKSGMKNFTDNLNQFISDKRLLGSCTTSLYEVEKILSDIVTDWKTGDFIVDGSIHLLNEKRCLLEDAKRRIKEKVGTLVDENSSQIREWGNQIANKLTSAQNNDEVNRMLVDRQNEVDKCAEKLAGDIEKLINVEVGNLQKKIEELENKEFARDLKIAIEERVKQIDISDKTQKNIGKAGEVMRDFGTKIASMSMGANAGTGLMSLFKTSAYSGSKLHDVVIKVGHLFGHKFKPWQAVRWTKNIANGFRIVGVVGSVLTVGLQIYNDRQEVKMEQQLAEGRNEIRTCFLDASKVIDLEYNKATDTWMQNNLDPYIEKIDEDIDSINDNIQNVNDLYLKLNNLLKRVRGLISDIQSA